MWEIETTNDWNEAKELAGKGWELVNVSSVIWDGRDGSEISTEYYFKRLIK